MKLQFVSDLHLEFPENRAYLAEHPLKMTGDASSVDVNAWEQHTYGCLNHVTLYPSPYMVLTEQGYTNVTEVESRASSLALPRCSNVTERKHYYAGTERVAARLGSGGLSYDATCVTGNGEVAKRSDELFWEGLKALNEHKTKPEDFKEMSLVDARGKEVDWLKKIDPGKIHFIIDDNSYPAMPGNTRYENELIRELSSFGKDLIVLSPDNIRQKVFDHVVEQCKAYQRSK